MISTLQDGTAYIAGARDRSLTYCNFACKDVVWKDTLTSIGSAHNGWIWDVTTIDNTIYSCSWDQTVKSWMLADTGLMHQKTYKMYTITNVFFNSKKERLNE